MNLLPLLHFCSLLSPRLLKLPLSSESNVLNPTTRPYSFASQVAGEDVELLSAQLDVVLRVYTFKRLYKSVTEAGDSADSKALSLLSCAAEACQPAAPGRLIDWLKEDDVDRMMKSVEINLSKARSAAQTATVKQLCLQMQRCNKVARGGYEGRSWKDDLPSNISFEKVHAKAKSSGLLTDVELAGEIKASLASLTQVSAGQCTQAIAFQLVRWEVGVLLFQKPANQT